MLDGILSFFGDLFRSMRVADVLDIALVAVFLYALISWLRQDTGRTAPRRALIIIMVFIAINGLADAFQMYLVEQLLELLLIVFLVAAVVVFQADIRRLLDRIGSWSFFRRSLSPSKSSEIIDVLTETAAGLAEQHVGALIAIKGDEPWERLIHGGVPLKGEVSLPLLESIFDPSTPGHDGVVLIEDQRVSRFAAHLPLTQNLPEASRFGGTRHAAALGLSEQCDAFVIIVSEERGAISVAHGNHITELESASELKARLEQFWEAHFSRGSTDPAHRVVRRRMQMAGVATALSAILWILFAYSQETGVQSLTVPVTFRNVPSEWTLVDINPAEVRIVVAGSERAFHLLDESSVNVSFDLSDPEPGGAEYAITEANLNLPSELRLDNVEPQSVRVEAIQLQTVAVPIRVQTEGQLADSLVLVSASTNPDTLRLRVPATKEQPRLVWTQPVDLRGIQNSAQMQRRLELDPEWRLAPEQSNEVTVSLEIERAETVS